MLGLCILVKFLDLAVATISSHHGNLVLDAVFKDLVLEPFNSVFVVVAKVRWTKFKVNFSLTTLLVPGNINICVRCGIQKRMIFRNSINPLLGVVRQEKRSRCHFCRPLPPHRTRVIVKCTRLQLHVACLGAGETLTLCKAHRAKLIV